MEGQSPALETPVSSAIRRLNILRCAFFGISVLSMAGIGGYMAYKKIQDNNNDSKGLTVTTPTPASLLFPNTLSVNPISTTAISSTDATLSDDVSVSSTDSSGPWKDTSFAFTERASQLTRDTTLLSIQQTAILSKDSILSSTEKTVTLTKSTKLTSTEQPATTARATTPTSNDQRCTFPKASTLTSIDPATTPTKTTTMPSTEQTAIPTQETTQIPSSVLGISSIDSDPCLGEPSAKCSNGSETGTLPSYCVCDSDGIWTIIQRRFNGSVNFYRNWTDYKAGFGYVNGEYWLGNDAIHQITYNANYTLKVILKDWNDVSKYAKYDTFRISDEADGYRLNIGGYSGDAGDSLATYHNAHLFSTQDSDNDNHATWNCAETYGGAWWYNTCAMSNLNGLYYIEPDGIKANGVTWNSFNSRISLKETTMMIQTN